MKLKKGSLEAKRFMAKIRAKKGKAKTTISRWRKGNTRMLEVGEKVFKTKKNVRVKRKKLGTFKKFTTLSGLNNAQMSDFNLSKQRLKEYEEFLLYNLNELKNKKLDKFAKKQNLYENRVYKQYIKNYKTHINNLKKLL